MRRLKRLAAAASLTALVTVAAPSAASVRAFFWGALNVSAAPTQLAKDARIFVSLTNTSTKTQTLKVEPMCRLTDLVVTDAEGRVQAPAEKSACPNGPGDANVTLPSNGLYKGEEFAERPGAGDRLALWGYALPVGTYRIYAIPTTSLWPDRSFIKEPETSDLITVTLH